MVSVNVFNQKLWVVTRSGDDKVTQIQKNPKVEFTYAVPGKGRTGCLRATAEAVIVDNQETRNNVVSSIPWFTNYWKSFTDSDFTLIRLDLKQILFDHHETSSKYAIDL